MNDNEKVKSLMNGLVETVNAAELPLAVKVLALENVLFRVKEAMRQSDVPSPASAAQEVQKAEKGA